MKKLLFPMGCALLLVLALAGSAAAQSKSNAPLRCFADLAVSVDNPTGDWFGTVSGDIKGDIAITERDGGALSRFPGKTQHFVEDWTIYVGGYPSAVTIRGYWEGVYNVLTTLKFRANGRVTNASPQFQRLVRHKVHAMGITSALNPDGPVFITGQADIFIAGP